MRFVILTVSDRSFRAEREDLSGPVLKKVILKNKWEIVGTSLVPDEKDMIIQELIEWADGGRCDVILTTGGTGFAPRDVTPEATLNVIDRQAPGLAEAMRLESLKITPHAMLSRAVCGIRKQVLIINLPGSPKAALENLGVILPVLPHAIQLLRDHPDSESGHMV
jgi:molybdenum cofactor synthesis domain-containing protein